MELTKQVVKDSSIGRKIVVEFYADWCEPCQKMKPVLEQLAAEYESIKVVFVNVDDYPEGHLKAEFGVIAIPHMQFWNNGKKTKFLVGGLEEHTIRDEFNRLKRI